MRSLPPSPPSAWHPPDAARERGSGEGVDLRRLVGTLWRHRWHVLAVACLVIVPVAIWTEMTEPLYRASTLLEIDPDPVQVFPYRELDRPTVVTQFEMFLKGQDELLRGQTLRARVARRLSAESEPQVASEAGALDGRLEVQGIENTYMFRASYLAPSPDVAARVANIFAEEYIKQHFETRQQTREKARELLQRELELLESRVQQSEKGLVTYAQDNRLSVDEKDESPARVQLGEIALQRTQAEAEVFAARSKLQALQGASVDEFPETLVNDTIGALTNGVLRMESDLSALQATFGPNWPAVVAKRQEITLTRDQLAREKRIALAQALQQARLDLAVADGKRGMVVTRLAEQQAQVNQIDNATIQYNIIRREVDTNQKMYDGMLERLRQTSLTSGMDFGGIQVVERAVPSESVDSPKVWWNLGLASLFGLALGVCLVVGRDYWDTSLSTVEELAYHTGLPVLGAVPHFAPVKRLGVLASGRRKRLLTADATDDEASARLRFETQSPSADAVRNVCTSILLSRSDRPPRVLMVTSAMSGEGKTTMSRELAYAFAERGARAVLVECDLRRPKFAQLFNVGEAGGMTPWLAGATATPPTVHELDDGLSVVAAGPRAPNPVALLHSERMRGFVKSLLTSYRFVILDASPALGVADARVLASVADGAVLVARAGKSQGSLLRAVRGALESAGITVLGTVLNGTDPKVVTSYLSQDYYS